MDRPGQDMQGEATLFPISHRIPLEHCNNCGNAGRCVACQEFPSGEKKHACPVMTCWGCFGIPVWQVAVRHREEEGDGTGM